MFLSVDCSYDRNDDKEISHQEKDEKVAQWCQSLNTLAKMLSGEVVVQLIVVYIYCYLLLWYRIVSYIGCTDVINKCTTLLFINYFN